MKSKKQGIRKANGYGDLVLAPFRVERHGSNSYRGVISYPFCKYLNLKANSERLLLVGDHVSGISFILRNSILISRFEPILRRQREIAHKIIDEAKAEVEAAEGIGSGASSDVGETQ